MNKVWELVNEARTEIIGGLVVAGLTALIAAIGQLYTSVGWPPFLIGGLVLLWVGYLGYLAYWLIQRRGAKPGADSNDEDTPRPRGSEQLTQHAKEGSMAYYPCFVSYSHKDEAFAQLLYTDLRSAGVSCWYAPEDMKIGDKIRPTIDRAIRSHARLLIILSEHSIDSAWVEKEVETAFEEEHRHGETLLFPIRLDGVVMQTDQAWAADIRRTRHIGDFTHWKDHDSYQQALDRLFRDLKASEA